MKPTQDMESKFKKCTECGKRKFITEGYVCSRCQQELDYKDRK